MSDVVDVHERLIREAFIDPIRTMIMVDDEYPTLDSLIAKELGSAEDAWSGQNEEIERVRAMLEFARSRAKPWLVDVHDAKRISTAAETSIATHLDHSDLLVLDYHLLGDPTDGTAAIEILRRLASSDHFNLVIVYTKGYTDGLSKVVQEIALGLTWNNPVYSFASSEETESVSSALAAWQEQDDDIETKLLDIVSVDTYLQLRSKYFNSPDGLLGMAEGTSLLQVFGSRPKEIQITPKQLAAWIMAQKHSQLFKQFSPSNLGHIQVGAVGEDINWIRSDKLFITVLSKACEPNQLEEKLTTAIKESFPSPHRLLLTKIRSVLDQYGLLAEAAILANQPVQAVWLDDFLNPNPVDTKGVIRNTINRHWEALGDELAHEIENFSESLRTHFTSLGLAEVMNRCGLPKNAHQEPNSLKAYNSFASTKRIDRAHLTTGHIFCVTTVIAPEVAAEETYWICLSPACDMVPGQKDTSELKNCIGFVAVKLHRVSDKTALEKANSNAFVFIEVDGEIQAYSIYKDGAQINNPQWHQKFARNQGRFGLENSLTLGYINESDAGELITTWESAKVVAQLRSEYALNLLQRIGALLSRPGLGINFKKNS